LDFGGQLDFDTDFGRIKLKANAAQIRKFFQDPSAEGQLLIDAVNSGTLNPLVDVVAQEDLIKENGNPEWRYTGSIRWDQGAWGLGAFYRYVGDVRDTSVTGADYDFLEVPAFRTLNLYGDYTFEDEEYGIFDNVRLRFGVRNVGDKKPPIADEFARGYFVSLHSNRGRYWYGSVRKTF
jgi:outer membrane receptor protein involved in Fe transport